MTMTDGALSERANVARAKLIEDLANIDDEIAELFLEGAEISPEHIHAGLRRYEVIIIIHFRSFSEPL